MAKLFLQIFCHLYGTSRPVALIVLAATISEIWTFNKNFDLENLDKIHWVHTSTMMPFDGEYQLINVIERTLDIPLTNSDILQKVLKFQNVDRDNFGQRRLVPYPQWRHLMTNINVYKSSISRLALALTVPNVSKLSPWKLGQDHVVHYSRWCCLMANINVYKRSISRLALAVTVPNVSKLSPWKLGQDHLVHYSRWCCLIANINVYKNRITHFCA